MGMGMKTGSKGEQTPIRADLLDILSSGTPPAFATDADDRIVFWNRGAEELLGQSAEKVLGKPCYVVVGGRDLYGNRFCYKDCAVVAATRDGEPVNGYEFQVCSPGKIARQLNVTIVQIPGQRPEAFTIVHLLQPVEAGTRMAALLRQLDTVRTVPEGLLPLATLTPPLPEDPPLTDREREILKWVAAGLQNKEIAHKLDISLATVRNHIHRILEKLEVHSKLEAVSLAFRRGWVELEAAPAALEN
jgi:PAS domain S-box-containing protein